MKDDIYIKLGDRLNQFNGKTIVVDSWLELLKEMYPEEEAQFAINFPKGPFTLAELTVLYKKTESELLRILEKMTDTGTILTYFFQGERKYELTPFFPGAIEYYLISLSNNPIKLKQALDLQEKAGEETVALIGKLMLEDPEKARALTVPNPALRTITINGSLPVKQEVHSYESILKMIDMLDEETPISAMKCPCRQIAKINGSPCQIHGVPEYSCLSFGKAASYVIERKDAKQLTKEECKELLELCNQAGLVQNINNFVDGIQFLCNCCKCCCKPLELSKKIGPAGVYNASNFAPVIDEASCTGCGVCVERCPLSAISFKNDLAVVSPDACIGCGNCTPACPVGSISMTRIADKKPLM